MVLKTTFIYTQSKYLGHFLGEINKYLVSLILDIIMFVNIGDLFPTCLLNEYLIKA